MKLAIFDKDGTLVAPVSGGKFVQHSADQMILPGVTERISAMADDGWVLVIVSNQGGVAAGHKSQQNALAEMQYCLSMLPEIRVAFFCPDFAGNSLWAVPRSEQITITDALSGQKYPQANEDGSPMMAKPAEISADSRFIYAQWKGQFRKPNPGMIQAAMAWVCDDVSDVLFIGDRPEDQQAAESAGVDFIWAEAWRNGL